MKRLLWLTLPVTLLLAGCGDDYAIVYRSPSGMVRVVEDAAWTQRKAFAFSRQLETAGYARKGSTLVVTHDAACDLMKQNSVR